MNFGQLRGALQPYDEILPIGRDVERDGKAYHIIGMVRRQKKVEMYVIEQNDSEEAQGISLCERHTNRESMKVVSVESYFSQIEAFRIGGFELETGGVCSGPLELDAGYDCESALLFADMIKAGWSLPDESVFLGMEWKNIWMTRMTFRTEAEKLPVWENQEICVRVRGGGRTYYIEEPVCLIVGEERELAFSFGDGEKGICYINRVYAMDVWKEYEEMFQKQLKDPRILERMTIEQANQHKEEFFRMLSQDCPEGMCYLGIEYECTPEGNLAFYSREFLDAEREANTGSARALFMLLRPEEPVGSHGLRRQGCVIQTPCTSDIRQMEAELFHYTEKRFEKEEFL